MKKAIIEIKENKLPFTSVYLEGHNYGYGKPCETEEEVKIAIEHCIELCKENNQKYTIVDTHTHETH